MDPVLDAENSCAASRGGLFALEVIDQTRSHTPRLNKQLIPILEAASGPPDSDDRRRFSALLTRWAKEEAAQVLRLHQPNASREHQLQAALRVAPLTVLRPRAGTGTPAMSDMIEAGCNVVNEPFLAKHCQKGIDGALDKLRKGKLRLNSESVTVMGFPDFTGDLAPGEIFLVVDGRHYQPLSLSEVSDGDGTSSSTALVYRPPGVRAGDVRKVRSVYSARLHSELFGDGRGVDLGRASAVFFSTRGERPLADLLAGV